MIEYGVAMMAEPMGTHGRCDVRACAFPGRGVWIWDKWRSIGEDRVLCWGHFIKGSVPFSMEYEHTDAILGVPRGCVDGREKHVRDANAWRRESPTGHHVHAHSMYNRGRQNHWTIPTLGPIPKMVTHKLDAVYSAFGTEFVRSNRYYTLCGESVTPGLIASEDKTPTCEDCQRILEQSRRIGELVASAEAKRPVLAIPLVKNKGPQKQTDDWEVVAIEGFQNRRNWGERRSGEWSNPETGVQRFKHHRSRGGVNSHCHGAGRG